ALPARRSSLARSWIQPVTSVSAGPPLGGLYLMPPSSGGLCDGVMMMPSAWWPVRPRLWTSITYLTLGDGSDAVDDYDAVLELAGDAGWSWKSVDAAPQGVAKSAEGS